MIKIRIAVRGGHNPYAPGANGLINEVAENRKVYPAVIKYLRELGHTVYDVTPPNMYGAVSDLAYGVNKANQLDVDLLITIHFNNAYSTYSGKLGSEVCVYSPFPEAQRVATRLYKEGFTTDKGEIRRNNGLYVNQNLYELKNTKAKAMIIEVCFVEATKDAELYKRLGADYIGKCIAEAVANKSIPTAPTGKLYRVQVGAFEKKGNADALLAQLKEKGFDKAYIKYE